MIFIRIGLICLVVYLSSCLGTEFQSKVIVGNYYVVTTDNFNTETSIRFKLENGDFVGVLRASVSEVGFNDKYIIARQHPFATDKKKIDYYIIPIQYEPTFWPEKGIIGPLSLNKFKEKTKELSIDAKFEY